MIAFVLILLALVCFVLATFGLVARLNWIALGLAFLALNWLIGAWPG